MKIYRIRDWSKHFENNRTRELKRLEWVPVPNKHDGDGFTDLLSRPNGMALYGAWNLILQVASKCEPRGELVRHNPAPSCGGGVIAHDAHSIARVTRGDPVIMESALSALLEIGWLEVKELPDRELENPAPACGIVTATPPPHPAPACGKVPMEWKGMEGNGIDAQTNIYPTLAEVKALAAMTGVRESEAEQFWHHFEASGWVDKNGNKVAKWQSKLATWTANARAAGLERAHHANESAGARTDRPKSVFELTKIKEAKDALATKLKNEFYNDGPLGGTWKDQSKRVEWKKLRDEIKTITEKIASL